MKEKKKKDENIEALRFALNNQINWQKYAEGKLLLLTSISGASMISLRPLMNSFESESGTILFKIVFSTFAVCSFVAFIIGILSMILNFKILKKDTYFGFPKQLINWRYIVDKEIEDLIKEAKEYNTKNHREDIMIQHYLGAWLTNRKYKRFNCGAITYSIGLITLFVYFLIFKILTLYS